MYFVGVAAIVKAEKNESRPCHAICVCTTMPGFEYGF